MNCCVNLSLLYAWMYLRQWGFGQCLPFSCTTLRGKYCWHPIGIMGVVDTFGPCDCVSSLKEMINRLWSKCVCPCVCVSSLKEMVKKLWWEYVCPCLCVQSIRDGQEIMTRPVLRSFLILCVSVCLYVQSKRDGQEIMMRMCVSVCLCVQSKRDSQEIMIRPLLDLSLLYVCVRVSVCPL